MSVPSKNTTWGEVLYEGKTYGVLYGFHMSDDIWEKYNQYDGEKEGCFKSTAPWTYMKPRWIVEEDKLYLTGLCEENLLAEVMEKEKILADWVSEIELLAEHRRVCKTYEKGNSYLNEMQVLYLKLDRGVITSRKNETELYTSNELKTYIDRYQSYITLRINATDLMWYLEDEKSPLGDQFFPIALDHIKQMIQKGSEDDISLTIEDINAVLINGQLAVLSSARGSDIEEMVGSLVDSMTDEVLEAKGCLMHFTMHKDYPVANIEKIVSSFEKKLGYDKEDPLDAYIPNRNVFVFGTQLSDEMGADEVLIRMLIGI